MAKRQIFSLVFLALVSANVIQGRVFRSGLYRPYNIYPQVDGDLASAASAASSVVDNVNPLLGGNPGWNRYSYPYYPSIVGRFIGGGVLPSLGLGNPGLVNPGLVSPGLVNSGLTNLGLVRPGLANLGLVSPGLANLGLASPGLANLGLVNPGLANGGANDNAAAAASAAASAAVNGGAGGVGPGNGYNSWNGYRPSFLRPILSRYWNNYGLGGVNGAPSNADAAAASSAAAAGMPLSVGV
nr:PREDICTED: spidroin-1 [Linepithema humile]